MGMDQQHAADVNNGSGADEGRVRLLLRHAETLDQDAIESLPGIIREIREQSARAAFPCGEAECLLLEARYHMRKDHYAEAIALAERAEQQFTEASETLGRAKAFHTLGYSYGQLGWPDRALDCYMNGLRLFTESEPVADENGEVRGNLLGGLASVYSNIGRYDEAIGILREVQKFAEKSGGAPLVVVLTNLCEAYLKMGNTVDALVYNQRALMEIKTKSLGNQHLYMCHSNFGMIYERSNQPEKALESYREALNAAIRMNNRYCTVSAQALIGALNMKIGDSAGAMEALRHALQLADEISAYELMQPVLGCLVEEYERAGNYPEALRCLKRLVSINANLGKRELEHRLNHFTAEHRITEARKDAEIHRLKNVELRQKTEEIERKAQELEEALSNIKSIGEIGQRITNSLDAATILNTAYESVSGLMDAAIVTIGLIDDVMDIVDYRLMAEGGKRLPLIQVSAEDPNSFAAQVITGHRELLLGNADTRYTENAAMPGCSASGKCPKSIICCPLALSDRVIGVFAVQSHEADAYSERNLETVKALATYTAIALNNAQQSDEIRAKAKELELASHTDVLTGLSNRRHVMEKINEECIRFQRSGKTFSLIICDIDFFKKVNDTYGHDCGDAVLKALSGLLGRHIRRQDCLARWGGEEFLMLLPETNLGGAAVLAEKLRRRVEEYEFVYAGAKVPITMSFGAAEYIRDYGADACIVGADSALYKAKADGRNRVVTF